MRKPGKPSLKLVHGGPPADGTREIFDEVYKSCREQLVRLLMLQLHSRSEAEDVAQEAYLKLASKDSPLLNQNLRALLFITARNLAFDARRRTVSARRFIDAYDNGHGQIDTIPSAAPSADRVIMARQEIEQIRQFLEELPPKCRYAFIAYRFDERDYATIASEMAVSESMVRKYVIRALAHCSLRRAEMEGWE